MATYYTQKSRAFGTRIGQGANREIVVAEAIVAVTTAMIDNTNDVINLFYLPKGAVIVGANLAATDMDTNGTPTLKFDVGDSGSNARIFSASTVGQAGTLNATNNMVSTALLYKFTADTLISAYVNTVSATGAAGTLYCTISYFVDPEYSTTALTATTTT